jgi:hypothetical protein
VRAEPKLERSLISWKWLLVVVIAVVVGAVTYRKAADSTPGRTVAGIPTPEPTAQDIERYVAGLTFEHEGNHAGAVLALTEEGLTYGSDRAQGAWLLAGWLMAQEGWQGDRTRENVAEEIWAHCVAWFQLPALRDRANPVNLEFHSPWPRNLVSVALAHARRALFKPHPAEPET